MRSRSIPYSQNIKNNSKLESMKNLLLSFLALTFLFTSCRDTEAEMLDDSPILEGAWEGHWIDDLETVIQVEIWLDSSTDEMKLEFIETDTRIHTLDMTSETQFKIAQHEVGDEFIYYEAEYVEEVLYISRTIAYNNLEGRKEAQLRKVK